MVFNDTIGVNLKDISGTITVQRSGQKTTYPLDQHVIDQWVPFDRVLEIPVVSWEDQRLEPVVSKRPAAPNKLPHHRVRGTARYLLHAAAGDEVRLRWRHQAVGRQPGEPMQVAAVSPTGTQFQQVAVALGEDGEYSFTADATGVFLVRCEPGRHTVQVVDASHPVCIAGSEDRIHLLGTTGDFCFWVPSGVERLGLRLQGEGEGERVSVTIYDSQGQIRWQQANIGYPQSCIVQREPDSEGQVWRMKIERPEIGVLEDIHVVLRGVPALLGFEPHGLLRPDSQAALGPARE
jgi:hypothetical protein